MNVGCTIRVRANSEVIIPSSPLQVLLEEVSWDGSNQDLKTCTARTDSGSCNLISKSSTSQASITGASSDFGKVHALSI